MRNHLARVENFLNFSRAFQSVRQKRSFAVEFARQPFDLLLFAPLKVGAQSNESRHGVDRFGVAIGFLSNIKLHQAEAKALHLANDVKEIRVGNLSITNFNEGLVARDEW